MHTGVYVCTYKCVYKYCGWVAIAFATVQCIIELKILAAGGWIENVLIFNEAALRELKYLHFGLNVRISD